MAAPQESAGTPQIRPESALQSSTQPHVINARFFNTRNLAIIVSGVVFSIALFKADSKDIPQIVQTIVNSEHVAIIGWVVAVIILVAAIALIWVLCKIYNREIERLVKERDRLQEHLLGKNG